MDQFVTFLEQVYLQEFGEYKAWFSVNESTSKATVTQAIVYP